MSATLKQDMVKNLEFQIAFSETNLRWLAGEPDSENKLRAIKTNIDGINEACAKLLLETGTPQTQPL